MKPRNRAFLTLIISFVIIAMVLTLMLPYNIFASFHLLAAIIGILLLFLAAMNLEGKSRIFFSFAILFCVFWSATHFRAMTLPEGAIWGARTLFSLDMIFITFMSSFIGLFTFYFDRNEIPISSVILCLLPIIMTPPLLVFDLVDAKYVQGYGWDTIQSQIFFIPYIILVAIPALYGLYNLNKVRKVVKGEDGQNISLLIIGLLLALFVSETIDGFLHPFLGFPSLGSVGITMGLLIMCVPYVREIIK
jgi:hypothetical protein